MNQRDLYLIDRIESRYDAENDTACGVPAVTWTDHALLELVRSSIEHIDKLLDRIEKLEKSQKPPD